MQVAEVNSAAGPFCRAWRRLVRTVDQLRQFPDLFGEHQILARGFGSNRYVTDQLVNTGTVELNPCGLWGKDAFVDGRFATASNAVTSMELLKIASAAVRRNFQKIKAF